MSSPHRQNILITGATSGIAKAIAHQLAERGDRLILAGRDEDELSKLSSDMNLRHDGETIAKHFEATKLDEIDSFFTQCVEHFAGQLDGVIICHGYMAEQAEAEQDVTLALQMINVNYSSAVCLLELAANHMKSAGAGWLCGVSSVAGDRGRQSNYLYGSTKAALSTYLQGLRNRLSPNNIHVLTVKPGFVDTAMTWGLVTDSPLTATPDKVAKDIIKAIDKRKNILYTPWFWRIIMAIIRSIPERVFKKMKM